MNISETVETCETVVSELCRISFIFLKHQSSLIMPAVVKASEASKNSSSQSKGYLKFINVKS